MDPRGRDYRPEPRDRDYRLNPRDRDYRPDPRDTEYRPDRSWVGAVRMDIAYKTWIWLQKALDVFVGMAHRAAAPYNVSYGQVTRQSAAPTGRHIMAALLLLIPLPSSAMPSCALPLPSPLPLAQMSSSTTCPAMPSSPQLSPHQSANPLHWRPGHFSVQRGALTHGNSPSFTRLTNAISRTSPGGPLCEGRRSAICVWGAALRSFRKRTPPLPSFLLDVKGPLLRPCGPIWGPCLVEGH